jgi:hypothetical protein
MNIGIVCALRIGCAASKRARRNGGGSGIWKKMAAWRHGGNNENGG